MQTEKEAWEPPKADKLDGPKIIGKINLHKIDNSTRPKVIKPKTVFNDRDYLDSGWGHSAIMLNKNYHKEKKKK